MEKLKKLITEKYKKEHGAKTSMWSEGNGDDQFSDGVDNGYATALFEVAKVIGMEVEPLEEQSYD